MNRIFFGVDPSFRAFGVVVYDSDLDEIIACHTFRTAKQSKKRRIYVADDDARRLADVTKGYHELLLLHNPDLIFSETPSGGALSHKAAKGMAYATALTTIIPLITGHTVVHITAKDSKKASTGKVNGSKAEVEQAVKIRFPGAPFHPSIKVINEHQHDAASVLMAGMLTPHWAIATRP